MLMLSKRKLCNPHIFNKSLEIRILLIANGRSLILLCWDSQSFSKDTIDCKPALLVVFSDIPYPGWTATIDDQQQTIYPSNIIGKGIFVDSGYHKIVFNYNPKYYYIGIILSIIGLLSFLIYWYLCRKTCPSTWYKQRPEGFFP